MTKLQPDDLEVEARDWADILCQTIPENMLRECHRLAEINPNRRVEDMNFPLRRREIIDAWYRLQAARPKEYGSCNFCQLHFHQPEVYPACLFHQNPVPADFLVNPKDRMQLK